MSPFRKLTVQSATHSMGSLSLVAGLYRSWLTTCIASCRCSVWGTGNLNVFRNAVFPDGVGSFGGDKDRVAFASVARYDRNTSHLSQSRHLCRGCGLTCLGNCRLAERDNILLRHAGQVNGGLGCGCGCGCCHCCFRDIHIGCCCGRPLRVTTHPAEVNLPCVHDFDRFTFYCSGPVPVLADNLYCRFIKLLVYFWSTRNLDACWNTVPSHGVNALDNLGLRERLRVRSVIVRNLALQPRRFGRDLKPIIHRHAG